MDAIREWGWAVALGINMLMGWGLWSLRTGFVPRVEFDGLRQQVALIEREVAHLPTSRDLTNLRGDVAKLQAQADATTQLLTGLAATVARIETYLLNTKV